MAGVNVANNPIGSYPVKVTKEGSGATTVNVQHVIADSVTVIDEITNVASVDTVDAVTAITNPVSLALTALTASSPTAATVGTSSSEAVPANANRTGLILVNTSNGTISLGIGATAVLESGITLAPNGSFVMERFSFTTVAINAIASASNSNLSIQEFV